MTNGEKLEQVFPDGICPFSHNWLKSEYKPSVQPKPKTDVLEKIRAEIHATAEMHRDGDYYLRDEWIDEIIDKYKVESEDKE